MLLFDEMEKTFSALEKVYEAQLEEREDWLDVKLKLEEAADAVVFYAMETFLKEGNTLHTLFLRAGIEQKRAMGYYLLKWMLINKRFNENRFNRADTCPARE